MKSMLKKSVFPPVRSFAVVAALIAGGWFAAQVRHVDARASLPLASDRPPATQLTGEVSTDYAGHSDCLMNAQMMSCEDALARSAAGAEAPYVHIHL